MYRLKALLQFFILNNLTQEDNLILIYQNYFSFHLVCTDRVKCVEGCNRIYQNR